MGNRKSAKDWRDAHKNAKTKLLKIENQIKTRAEELCKTNSSVPIGWGATGRGLEKMRLTMGGLSTNNYIKIIETIEKHLADKHPHQQGNLFN